MSKKVTNQPAEEKLSPRAQKLIDSFIEEIEEAGLDDEYAADESNEPRSARVTSVVGASRPRRRSTA